MNNLRYIKELESRCCMDAEKFAKQAKDILALRSALRVMGIDPDKVLEKKRANRIIGDS